MRRLDDIRNLPGKILAIGDYRPGYQATLDFDYLSGKTEPSILGIISGSHHYQKYFWGEREVLLPSYSTIEAAKSAGLQPDWMLNVSSARRAYTVTQDFFTAFPDAIGGHIFAEDVPETHALALYNKFHDSGKILVGPAGVGLIVPGAIKLGVVGGVDWRQIQANHLQHPGQVAVISASGGMINELITMTARKSSISFALCVGGDRFPITTPSEAFLAAEDDSATTHILYYGELGGQDEYEIVHLISTGKITKPVIAYIAGVIGENFSQPVQFGHAKALAGNKSETASAKREALRDVGVQVAGSMQEFNKLIAGLPPRHATIQKEIPFMSRAATIFTSTIAKEADDGYEFVGTPLTDWAKGGNIALQITTALLGKRPTSALTTEFVKTVFLLSVDHGPQVSGAVNTIITARAGKGLVDSLAAGLLTIGPRFGGAVSGAAEEWYSGVKAPGGPAEAVEAAAKAKRRIPGIGHKKYRLGLPDPRTEMLAQFVEKLSTHRYFDYAKAVEAITVEKKGNLILNVDGHIAALMLDILETEEHYSPEDLEQLIAADFFNALFVIPRSIGFVAHYLDQRRLDEGLFRLPDDDILLT